MDWIRLILDADSGDPEQLSELLADNGAVSVSLEDSSDHPIFEPDHGSTPLWPHTQVVGLFPGDSHIEEVLTSLSKQLGRPVNGRIEEVESRDWVRVWMDQFHPMRFGRRLWVCPSHCEMPDPEGISVVLDPGLAFGTGTHPTTALCLEWLDAHDLAGRTVLDYGCGSGILAVAAAKLGAAEVWAVDTDPQALTASTDNAARNQVESHLEIMFPDELPSLKVGLIIANILANPLQELAPRLSSLLDRQGDLVLSGVLQDQADEVMEAYRQWIDFAPVTGRDGWVILHGLRRDESDSRQKGDQG